MRGAGGSDLFSYCKLAVMTYQLGCPYSKLHEAVHTYNDEQLAYDDKYEHLPLLFDDCICHLFISFPFYISFFPLVRSGGQTG